MDARRAVPAAKFIKLGTGVRYLIDAVPGAPLKEKHIIPNIDVVLSLIDELGFDDDKASAPIKHLREMRDQLLTASVTTPTLTADQAKSLSAECRRVRDVRFEEAEKLKVVAYDPSESGGPGAKFRVKDILALDAKVLWGILLSLAAAAFALFSFGVEASRIPWVRDWYEIEWNTDQAVTTSGIGLAAQQCISAAGIR